MLDVIDDVTCVQRGEEKAKAYQVDPSIVMIATRAAERDKRVDYLRYTTGVIGVGCT